MELSIFSKTLFKWGIDFKKRTFAAYEKKNGLIKITNIITGEILAEDLDINSLTSGGSALSGFEELQDIIFNKACLCSEDPEPEIPFKIFDLSFDTSFE